MRTWQHYTPASLCERAAETCAQLADRQTKVRAMAEQAGKRGDSAAFNAAIADMTRRHHRYCQVSAIFYRELRFAHVTTKTLH